MPLDVGFHHLDVVTANALAGQDHIVSTRSQEKKYGEVCEFVRKLCYFRIFFQRQNGIPL
jgi:hypothetical protein